MMSEVLDNPFKGWTTIQEAADILGREQSTIRYWADKGKIACYPVGRKVRVVNLDEVKKYSKTSPTKKREPRNRHKS